MTKTEAANELISMYALYHRQYGDKNHNICQAITLAITALVASDSRDETGTINGETV